MSYRNIAESGNANAQHQPYVVTETLFDKGAGTLGWSVRTPDFKYVLYDKGRYREQLYDMHRRMLEEWMQQYGVKSSRADVPYVPRKK